MKLANKRRFNIKADIAVFSTTILSLAMLAGMSACQSEQSSPAALPQVQAQATLAHALAGRRPVD